MEVNKTLDSLSNTTYKGKFQMEWDLNLKGKSRISIEDNTGVHFCETLRHVCVYVYPKSIEYKTKEKKKRDGFDHNTIKDFCSVKDTLE